MVDQSAEDGIPHNSGRDADDTEVKIPSIKKTRLVRSRRQIYMQILAAMVILACGIVIGAGAALLRFKDNIVPNRVPPPGDIVDDMRARYDLTEEQAEKVKIAVKESGERMRTIFQGIKEKMDEEFKQLSADMKEILTPEQYKKWERDFKSRRGRRPGRFGPRRPGGPSGRPGSPGRPDGFHGPGPGGRSGPGGPDPNRRSGQRRGDYERYGSRQRGPTEPNAVDE